MYSTSTSTRQRQSRTQWRGSGNGTRSYTGQGPQNRSLPVSPYNRRMSGNGSGNGNGESSVRRATSMSNFQLPVRFKLGRGGAVKRSSTPFLFLKILNKLHDLSTSQLCVNNNRKISLNI